MAGREKETGERAAQVFLIHTTLREICLLPTLGVVVWYEQGDSENDE